MSRVLEADESGALTIPADILGAATPRARYVAKTDEREVRVEREQEARREEKPAIDEWMRQWEELSAQIGAASITDRSAVDILSEMRDRL